MNDLTVYIYLQSYELSKPYLSRALDSVINQTYKNFVCCIYDNCSGPAVRSILQEYAKKDSRFQVRLFDYPVNLVYDYAFPEILHMSEGKGFFTWIDADDELENDCLEKLVMAAKLNKLDMVVAGATFLDGTTGNVIGQRSVDRNIIVSGNEYGVIFQQAYQLMRTHWIKLCKMEIIKSFNHMNIKLLEYGSDTAFVREILLLSNRIGILRDCLYKYYQFSMSNRTYNANSTRIFSPQNLLEMDISFLIKKCGCISEGNAKFLYSIYIVELNDLFELIKNGNLGENKLDLLYAVLCNDYFKTAVNMHYHPLYKEIARYLTSLDILKDIASIKKAAQIFAVISLYPSDTIGGSTEKFVFLLQCIHSFWSDGDTKDSIEDLINSKIKEIPLLSYVNSFFVCQCDDIISKLAFSDIEGVLQLIRDYFKSENCYYRENWERELIIMALNISAMEEDPDSFVEFKKLEIEILLKNDWEKAKAEIAEWIKILPDDVDLIALNNRLPENITGKCQFK